MVQCSKLDAWAGSQLNVLVVNIRARVTGYAFGVSFFPEYECKTVYLLATKLYNEGGRAA